MYLPDTNILLTRFLADEGVAELTDYMPIASDGKEPNEIVRSLSVVRGDVLSRCAASHDSTMQCVGTGDLDGACAIFSP